MKKGVINGLLMKEDNGVMPATWPWRLAKYNRNAISCVAKII
jgi:hypothetical protein